MIKKMVWNKYLQEEGLDKYPEIVKLFDSDSEAIKLVKQALLNDRILRPVFMQVLPEEKTGKMEICNKKVAEEKIKGDKILADYIMENKGIFLCGKPKIRTPDFSEFNLSPICKSFAFQFPGRSFPIHSKFHKVCVQLYPR